MESGSLDVENAAAANFASMESRKVHAEFAAQPNVSMERRSLYVENAAAVDFASMESKSLFAKNVAAADFASMGSGKVHAELAAFIPAFIAVPPKASPTWRA